MLRVMSILVLAPLVCGFAAPVQDAVYDTFIRQPPNQQRLAFAMLTAENKSVIKRAHAQHWLDQHRAELAASQVAVVEEAIAFVSPDLYRNPADAKLRQKEEALRSKLTCALGRRRVQEAFAFLEPAKGETWMEAADSWLSWFSDCVLK